MHAIIGVVRLETSRLNMHILYWPMQKREKRHYKNLTDCVMNIDIFLSRFSFSCQKNLV